MRCWGNNLIISYIYIILPLHLLYIYYITSTSRIYVLYYLNISYICIILPQHFLYMYYITSTSLIYVLYYLNISYICIILPQQLLYMYYITPTSLIIPSPTKLRGDIVTLPSKYVPSLVKIHWRMLILECSQGCYAVKIWPCDLDLWPMTLKIDRFLDSLKD
jgi:hypothetical protein